METNVDNKIDVEGEQSESVDTRPSQLIFPVLAMPRPSVAKIHPRFARAGIDRSPDALTLNFQKTIRLNENEDEFLHSAEFGDIPTVKRLMIEHPDININCTDVLGRNALRLAVKNEHLEIVELLLDKSDIKHINEAVLIAISAGHVQIAECILKHRRYLDFTKERRKFGATDNFYSSKAQADESEFSPDITPLILSAQKNEHEIVQLLLLRGESIPRPHKFSCHCNECANKTKFDQLRMAISRLNAYRALASEAYVSLSSKDPILTAFELSAELRQLMHVEKYFKTEYSHLIKQLREYVVKLMDRVRSHEELELILNKTGRGGEESFSNLARLKLAIQFEEKKFVAHPACQQRLVNIWYSGMRKLERSTWSQRMVLLIGYLVCFPFLVLLYLFVPGTKVARVMTFPCVKFVSHALSYVMFLTLIVLSTFETAALAERDSRVSTLYKDVHEEYTRIRALTNADLYDTDFSLRPRVPTVTQGLVLLWVVGFLFQECQQIYRDGISQHRKSLYNLLDAMVISFYAASCVLMALCMFKVNFGLSYFSDNVGTNDNIEKKLDYLYWLNADRFHWYAWDPMNLAEAAFSVANVASFTRISFLLPANEMLGPMQISLGKMIKDIMTFLSIFGVVLVAFLIGLNNLFWYYKSRKYVETVPRPELTQAEENFGGVINTFRTVFWSLFGRGEPSAVELNGFDNTLTRDVGYMLYGAYNVASVTVLLNMLIAMMTRSFDDIAGDADVEWKFSRSQLYMEYMVPGSVLPVPLNILTSFKGMWHVLKDLFGCCECPACCGGKEEQKETFNEWANIAAENGPSGAFGGLGQDNKGFEMAGGPSKKLGKMTNAQITRVLDPDGDEGGRLTYQKVMQSIVKRHIFEMQRGEEDITEDDFEEIKQDISSFRYEMLNLWRVDTRATELDEAEQGTMTRLFKMVESLRDEVRAAGIAPVPAGKSSARRQLNSHDTITEESGGKG